MIVYYRGGDGLGTGALLVICLFEIAFACYRIYSKSDLEKTKSIAQIILFLVFAILGAATMVEWGLRWYAFGAYLLVGALLGAARLVQKDRPVREDPPGRTIRKAVCSILPAALALTPVLIFPQHASLQPTGQYAIETAIYTYTDPDRVETYTDTNENRKVTVQFWYPQNAAGAYPLILFSHGSFGVRTSNRSLYLELASHGYVVAAIDHAYQSLYSRATDGTLTLLDGGYVQEVSREDAKTDPQQSYAYYQKWMGIRSGDIKFVLDSILAKANDPSADAVYRLVDPANIGVMGHSLGGSAALSVGRTREDISAVIALEAPFMGDIVGVENGKFVWNETPYPIPVLNVYSDSSWSHLDDWPQYAANARLLTGPPAAAYNVHMQGAGHLTLTDLALTSPFLTRLLNGQAAAIDSGYCLTSIDRLALQFFDRYLKGTGQFSPQESY